MKLKRSACCLGAAIALMISVVPPGRADEWNKETRVKISEPLEVPGKVLPPGTYIFKLAESQSDRNIVEIFSVDASGRQAFVATILTIPTYKLETPDKVMIGLEERPSGNPQAIHNWFYPGDNFGQEFVYPKSERLEIAANPSPVSAAPIQVTPVLPEPPAEPPVGDIVAEPAALDSGVSQPEEASILLADVAEDQAAGANRSLPETAGNSALELAAGLFTAVLGLIILFTSRRRAEA